ncbi:probable RNA-binding protein EIF1AD [Daphnia magna]|uniref:Probable RNA-binding protein EIF1AD n=1 Tax=Daphnia magna TaxID=35525 RepID=A0A0P5X5B8_9CRUS|nr:probable RNA-binding protein EIF1AD [Daphnia magna]KZS10120.1 putative RNA-binding protein EIF1AD [Daphnia magna]CAG4639705.1 EOG090X0KPP [Daphnia magna]SVE81729.1 EOG090X0KPP [Daphnia magna]
MSKTTKRKHVTKEVLDGYVLPAENQKIVKVLGGKGNNLHEVETAEGEKYLVSMPTKFRKNVWIKRGDYVLIQPIQEGEKVKAEILAILYGSQIKYIQSQEKWPKEFVLPAITDVNPDISTVDTDGSSKSDDDLFVNTNRPQCIYESTDDSDSDDSSSAQPKDKDYE